ncbi:MAG: baseplate J/gp47 family protein [bacterium]
MKYASDICQVMINKFLQLNQTITNFNIGSRIRSLFESAALGIEEVWFRIDTMFQGLFAATAHNSDLDLRALELGVSRKAAKKATGYVRFTGAQSTEVPEGTVCSTDPDIDPIVECLTTAQKTIPAAGYIDVPVEAKVAGEEGNIEAGKIIYLPQSIAGVTAINNLYAITGGADQEEDESLRKRIVLRWYALSYGGCEESFRSWALEVEGVAEAHAVACPLGPGTVKLFIWSKNEVGNLIPGSSELIDDVQNFIDERKPICTSVIIAQPTGILVDVFVTLEVLSGYVFSTVNENVRSAIIIFCNTLGVGDDLIVAQLLAAIMAVEGVKDTKIGTPKDNITCAPTDTIMLGRCGVVDKTWERQYVVW